MRKELGKIGAIRLGMGGYDDAMFGITVDLRGDGWGCGDFVGTWSFQPDEHCKWTVDDQAAIFDRAMRTALAWIKAAKVTSLDQLKGVPVEVTFDENQLVSWRILTEVL